MTDNETPTFHGLICYPYVLVISYIRLTVNETLVTEVYKKSFYLSIIIETNKNNPRLFSSLVIIKLDSRSKGRGFESHPIQDGNGFKVMPGSIAVPNPG